MRWRFILATPALWLGARLFALGEVIAGERLFGKLMQDGLKYNINSINQHIDDYRKGPKA